MKSKLVVLFSLLFVTTPLFTQDAVFAQDSATSDTPAASADSEEQILHTEKLTKLDPIRLQRIILDLFRGEFPAYTFDESSKLFMIRGSREEVERARSLIRFLQDNIDDLSELTSKAGSTPTIFTATIPDGKTLPESAIKVLEHWAGGGTEGNVKVSLSGRNIAVSTRRGLHDAVENYIKRLLVDAQEAEESEPGLWSIRAVVLTDRSDVAEGFDVGLDTEIQNALQESASSLGLKKPVVAGQLMLVSGRQGESRSMRGESTLQLDANASLTFDGVWLDGDRPVMETQWEVKADVVVGKQVVGGETTEIKQNRTVTSLTTKILPRDGRWTVIGSGGMPGQQLVFAIGFERLED